MVDRNAPPHIYQYQPPSERALKNLLAAQIWFSNPATFNDPFDCNFGHIVAAINKGVDEAKTYTCIQVVEQMFPRDSVHRDRVLTEISKSSEARIKELVRDAIVSNLKEVFEKGVSCFSAKKDCMLMWGHYGQSYHGFCLEFATSKSPFLGQSGLKKVVYSNKLPAFDLGRLAAGDFDHFLDFMITKPACWQYEQEWRILHKEMGHIYHYDRDSLTAIYFGARMEAEGKMMICRLMEKTDTKLFQMAVDPADYRLTWEPVSYQSIDYRAKKDPAD